MGAFGDMQELLQDFLTEAGELLEDVDSKLVELEQQPDDNNLLNTIFRGFHTIKGGAGFLEAAAMVELCHKTESLFDNLRSDKLKLSAAMMDVIMAATGEVRRMFGEMAAGFDPSAAPVALLCALDAAVRGDAIGYEAESPVKAVAPAATQPASVAAGDAGGVDWPGLYEAAVGHPPPDIGRAQCTAELVTQAVSREAAATVRAKAGDPKQKAPAPSAAVKESTIRVDTLRFDQILNLSGEIGLTKNRLNCLRHTFLQGKATEETNKTLDTVIGQLDMLVSDLQSAVMRARMQPVGRVFQKYSRMARDVSRQLGKDVELIISGAETEVDKTILEELNDPLIHLVRNAVDHGIEPMDARVAVGKPSKGIVTLSARQTGDCIVIEIQDDGRGMRPEFLRQKAIEKGLLSAEAAGQMSLQESLQLIFLPGFSTKTEITDVSGRGVGMDVVKTNIQRINGRIEIHSEAGHGSKITILLPLTLAILPVLMLRIEEQVYSLPLSSVREIVSIPHDQVQHVNGKPTLVVRGEVLPLLDLAVLIGHEPNDTKKVGVVAVYDDKRIVLAVDGLVGQDEVMIKPLDGIKPKGVTGATLSGEGLLVLVLELREILDGVV
jgi:two-component system chemotaxis sensor kinase CheA